MIWIGRGYLGWAAGLLVAVASLPAQADRRAYGFTYEAVTAQPGELDVEVWNTYANDPDLPGGATAQGYRGMLELEYGLTYRWDLAVYNLLDLSVDPAATGYGGFKIESRFRPLLAGEGWVDPVLYFEYQRLFKGDASQKGEVKLILAKDFYHWNVALNAALEVEKLAIGYNPEGEWSIGISRELFGPAFKFGVETFGKLEAPSGPLTVFAWVGPSLSVAKRFPGLGLWATLAAGRTIVGLGGGYYGRGIVGLQF